jgi:hypothetical protein
MKWNFPLTLVALLIPAAGLQAGTLTWTLQNVSFNVSSQGSVVGSFDYDNDTHTWSNVDVNNDQYWGLVTQYYSGSNTQMVFVDSLAADLTNHYRIEIDLTSGLTDAGGTVNIAAIYGDQCRNSNCSSYVGNGYGNVGTLVSSDASSSTPEPATASLLAGSGALLFLIRRRQALRSRSRFLF